MTNTSTWSLTSQVINKVAPVLADLAENQKLGDTIVTVLEECLEATSHPSLPNSTRKLIQEITNSKHLLKCEKKMAKEDLRIKQAATLVIKLEGNSLFSSGDITGASSKYGEALAICPLRSKKERAVLYSNRAQCHLLLQQPLLAISDATRALCLHSLANPHGKSLWRRAQAYEVLGLAKESLLDAVLFINEFSQLNELKQIPDYAERMVRKQMKAVWLFREAAVKHGGAPAEDYEQEVGDDSEWETVSESDIGNEDREERSEKDDE